MMQQKTFAGSSPAVGVQLLELINDDLVESVEQIIPLGFDQNGQCHLLVLFEPASED